MITFNRPNQTRILLNVLRTVKPKYLFVFQDGARNGNIDDYQKCNEVKNVLKEINWECDINTFFPEKNLGCGKGPSSAISWFFDFVEEGIILEDDCIPAPYFFTFCSEMLEKYRNNSQISFVGGTNFINNEYEKKLTYYFSSGHFGTWGWATWKRTWMKFDYYLNGITYVDFKKLIKSYYSNFRIKEYWLEIFLKVKNNRLYDTCWDYQFYFSTWNSNQLAIIPSQNLVKNIGTDIDATHTFGEGSLFNRTTYNEFDIIIHPQKIVQNKINDTLFHKLFIQPHNFGLSGIKLLPVRINKRIKKFLNYSGPWIKLLKYGKSY
jgi:hypothetical protein